MSRRGRPPGGDSELTRASIVDAAREVFAERGFSAATIAAMANAAGLAPSAVYHYFDGKDELYEAVFAATSDGIWSDLGDAVQPHATLAEGLRAMLDNARHLASSRPHYSDFLALVPMEARLQPQFMHLVDQRAKYQDAAFAALARLGVETGELAGLTHAEATEALRVAVMGWFFETHFRAEEIPGSGEALVSLFERFAQH